MIRHAIGALALAGLTGGAGAQAVSITFENLLPAGGLAFTPVFLGLHDGSFDLFDNGSPASPGLEEVAELGSTGTLAAEFASAAPNGYSATTAGGPIVGGGSVTTTLNVTNPADARYFSYASMVVPTNDLFIGNGNNLAFEIFDAAGNFNGPLTITLFGTNVYDAGTEVNNADNGAAFLAGIDATQGEVEGGNVSLFISDPGYIAYLDSLVGRTTAPGFVIESTFSQQTPIARITIVPTPGALAIAPLAGLAVLRRRR
ncbi:MAG: spondin domain-containing protein [Phycisphaerales bacterium]